METENSLPSPEGSSRRHIPEPDHSATFFHSPVLGFDLRRGLGFFLNHRVQNGSGTHTTFYPMGTGGSFAGVKRPRRETDHSPPYSAEVKNC
jgi:hypothetical protein